MTQFNTDLKSAEFAPIPDSRFRFSVKTRIYVWFLSDFAI